MLRDHLGWAHFTAEESEAPRQITWLMSHKQGSPETLGARGRGWASSS